MPGQPIHVPPRSRSTGSTAETRPPTAGVTVQRSSPDESSANGNRLETTIRRFIELRVKRLKSYIVTTGVSLEILLTCSVVTVLTPFVKSNMIPSALDHAQEIADHSDRLAVFLDYDGTLTPIVSHPQDAWLADSMRQALRELANSVPTAILSGRDLHDVQRRVEIDGI